MNNKLIIKLLIILAAIIISSGILLQFLNNKTDIIKNDDNKDNTKLLRDYCYKKTKNKECKTSDYKTDDNKITLQISGDDFTYNEYTIDINTKKITEEILIKNMPQVTITDENNN